MIILKILAKFIKVLRSGDSPSQIGWGFALGTILGLTPLSSLHNLSVVLLLIIFKVNLSAALLSWILYSLFGWVLDPVFHAIGYTVLVRIPFLQSLWITLYNIPIAPLTRFNNTVVMGSLLSAMVLLLPHYFLFRWFVTRYRESWNKNIDKWKVIKVLKGSKLVKFYLKLRKMGG